ncbi:MAG: HEAT repeat domain-containing protein [Candidatus Marinimicrobia bacterium]|nr:HEAT repeat domain-containing protein [Candidatus Neomarinimicrobiota bacterium]
MITKQYIDDLKKEGNGAIGKLVKSQSDGGGITYILENLGYLPKDFDGSWLPALLEHKNKHVRLWATKTIGKLKDHTFIPYLEKTALEDEVTEIRREAVSSIGRQHSENSKKILYKILKDHDPKIVCQAIRALLVFKGTNDVDKKLKALIKHQNEVVTKVIYKEYFAKANEKKFDKPHTESYEYLKNVVVNDDVREVLKIIPNDSFHLTFTSPPYYNARDYSIYPSYKAYLDFLEEVFQLTYNKTKEGRFLIVNTSPIIIPRISRQHSSKRYPIPFDIHHFLSEMGWEFIDDIVWVKPEASVKNRVGGFMQHRKPLGYKPNSITEYLMVYRKQTSKLLDWNIRQYDQKIVEESKVKGEYESNNVWHIDPTFNKVHSAVFPIDLCKRVVEYYSYKGDLVFDPFGGSGTFGRTAKSLDRFFFLTEQDTKYFEYMKTNVKNDSLFNERKTQFLTISDFKKTISK